VLLVDERVSDCEGDTDGPFDDLEGDEGSDRAIVGEMLGARQLNPAEQGQMKHEVFGTVYLLHGSARRDLAGGALSRHQWLGSRPGLCVTRIVHRAALVCHCWSPSH
jgi:hypothetical protein